MNESSPKPDSLLSTLATSDPNSPGTRLGERHPALVRVIGAGQNELDVRDCREEEAGRVLRFAGLGPRPGGKDAIAIDRHGEVDHILEEARRYCWHWTLLGKQRSNNW